MFYFSPQKDFRWYPVVVPSFLGIYNLKHVKIYFISSIENNVFLRALPPPSSYLKKKVSSKKSMASHCFKTNNGQTETPNPLSMDKPSRSILHQLETLGNYETLCNSYGVIMWLKQQ